MGVSPESPTTTEVAAEDDGVERWPPPPSTNDNATTISQLSRLKTLHDERMSNWTSSLDDPVFDYLNIPLVKVRYRPLSICIGAY